MLSLLKFVFLTSVLLVLFSGVHSVSRVSQSSFMLERFIDAHADVHRNTILDDSLSLIPDYHHKIPSSISRNANLMQKKLRQLSKVPSDLIFLIDSSSSIGLDNFLSILRFLKRILVHFDVQFNGTRISLITYSSNNLIARRIDYISRPSIENNKCKLFQEDLPDMAITSYFGGGTYTLGALRVAKEVFKFSRNHTKKALFLISDGYSNGGDPKPFAKLLSSNGIELHTFGIKNGNLQELRGIASHSDNVLILESFEQFEELARQIPLNAERASLELQSSNSCDSLCKDNSEIGCCDSNAKCFCSLTIGTSICICNEGYQGTGLRGSCEKCYEPTGVQLNDGNTNICGCKKGYSRVNGKCEVVKCDELEAPTNGLFTGECRNVYNAVCGIICKPGYQLIGSSIRLCTENATWNGEQAQCIVKKCPELHVPNFGTMNCTKEDFIFETDCHFECMKGYQLVGSKKRSCLAIAKWNGLPVTCRPTMLPI